MLRVKHVLVMTALLVCLMALPVLAQDAASATAATDVSERPGITILVIVVGFIAMFSVGGVIYMREKRREVD